MATKGKFLVEEPRSLYRQHFVKARRIRATTLHDLTVVPDPDMLMTPEAVAKEYALPVEAVLEAIAYVQSNPPEIQQDWEREERLMEATGMNEPEYKNNPSPKLLSAQELARILDS